MSHPTDNTHNGDPPPPPDSAPAETSLGPSNVFEVEELAPDGGLPPGEKDTAETPPPRPDPPRRKSESAAPPSPPPASPALDDDEPPPQLVWYVLKVQSGREDTIRDALERRVKIQGLQRYFSRIVVPTEKITEIRNNKKRIVERKSYPGYIMVEMELNEKTWFTVRETPGVGDFVGAHGTPTRMSEDEVNQMLGHETAKAEEAPRIRIDVEHGDRVKIKDGPFENFEGVVEEVIEARGQVKVMLTIFNRPTPVDLEYWQVERI
ncbi:MAG TPA: transcription termination/antitermination protein NusG [Isosphaeraceae bacterium]|nr:transcription termination/antitermination protein NusG [Isosphaeraceae bacterium]